MAADRSSPNDHNPALRFADAAHTVCESLHVGEHAGNQIGLGLALVVEAGLHAIDNAGADHGRIGMARDGRRLLGRPDAESYAERQFGMALDTLDMPT